MFHGAFPRSSVLILGPQQIHSLLPSTLISQAESLLSSHRIQDAIDLADQRRRKLQESITVDEDEADELRYVYQRIGFQCFAETMFEDAGTNFLNGDLDPRLLVSYYPELRGSLFKSEDALDVFSGVAERMPQDASVDDIIVMNLVRNYSPHLAPNTRSAPPTVELRKILNMTARDMLLSFLRKCRTKRITDEESGIPTKEAINITVDTVLAKLYALDGRRDDLHTLLQTRNYVVLQEVETSLRNTGLYSALCLIYRSRNDVASLLEILSKLVDGSIHDDSVQDPLSQILSLLAEKRERPLIQKWGIWLSKLHPDRGLELLKGLHIGKRRDRPEEDLATLQQLRQVNPLAAAQYLEYLVLTPSLHDELASSYVDSLMSSLANDSVSKLWRAKAASYASSNRNESSYLSYFASTTPDSDHKRIRLKAVTFLQASIFYDPKHIQDLLIPQAKLLPLELSIIEGKLGNHRSALQILANEMRDDISAETYCALGGQVVSPRVLRSIAEKAGILQWNAVPPVSAPQISRQNTSVGGELKGELLKLLLEVYMMDDVGPANRAARLLNAQASSLDIVDVISLIPPHWPLNTMSSFLTRSLRRTLHDVHEGQIVKMISSSQNLEVKEQTWSVLREQGAMIEEAIEDESGTSYDEKTSLAEKVALHFESSADEPPRTHDIHVNGSHDTTPDDDLR